MPSCRRKGTPPHHKVFITAFLFAQSLLTAEGAGPASRRQLRAPPL